MQNWMEGTDEETKMNNNQCPDPSSFSISKIFKMDSSSKISK